MSGLTSTAVSFIQQMANDLPAFWNLLIVFSGLAGFVICGYAVYRVVENQKRGESLMGAAGMFAAGVGLVNFVYFVNSATQTIGFSTGSLSTFSYTAGSGTSGAPGSSVPSFAFVILKFFGWLAAFRAFLLWSESARSGSPPGTVWRGTTHFVAGIFLINIQQFLGTMGSYMGTTGAGG